MKKKVSKQEDSNSISQVIMSEKKDTQEEYMTTEVILTELETLKLQNMAKGVLIYQLQAQQDLGQKQVELQKQIEDLKQKYSLDGNWEINPEGTKFMKDL